MIFCSLAGPLASRKRWWRGARRVERANCGISDQQRADAHDDSKAARSTGVEAHVQRMMVSLFESVAREQAQVVSDHRRPHVGLEVR